MKFKTLRVAAAVVALGACSQAALAEGGPEINVSGFGTLGFVTTNSDTAIFRNGYSQHNGATESDTAMSVDSNIGLQANVKFNDTLSAVGQILARNADGEFAPKIEWLYGEAAVTDWAKIRLGRMVLPVFMVSDFRHVGYANHWLRAPQEAYGLYMATSYDGIQGVFSHNWGGTNFTAQLSAGESKGDSYNTTVSPVVLTGAAEWKQLYSANLTMQNGNWTGRLGYTVGNDTDAKLAGTVISNGKDKFTGLGLQYDNGSLLVMSEYTMRRWSANGTSPFDKGFDSDGYYVSAGYRFGSVMPYVSISKFKPKGMFFTVLSPYAAAGNGSTNAVGVRWDFMKNVALKAQVEEVKGFPNSSILPIDAAFDPNKKLRAISVALDFVF